MRGFKVVERLDVHSRAALHLKRGWDRQVGVPLVRERIYDTETTVRLASSPTGKQVEQSGKGGYAVS